MQACSIRQHAECTVHRVAKNLFLSPDRPVSELLPYDLKDQDLFRTSFRSAAQHCRTEDYAWGRQCSVVAKSYLPPLFQS